MQLKLKIMKKNIIITMIIFLGMFSTQLFAQKAEFFSSVFTSVQKNLYRFTKSKSEKDAKFERLDRFGKYEVIPNIQFKGKNGKGENTWFYENEVQKTTLTILKKGGLKVETKLVGLEDIVTSYCGTLTIYANDKEKIYTITTGEKVTAHFENSEEDIDELVPKEGNLVDKFDSKKDFTVIVTKKLDLIEEKEIKLDFKNKNQEVSMDGKVFKLTK